MVNPQKAFPLAEVRGCSLESPLMNLDVLALYLGTWSLVALTPGPAVLCAMSHATRYGLRHSLIGILGIQLGHFVFFGCVASGLAALLDQASTAFNVIRVLGALYLGYLGFRILASSVRRPKPTTTGAPLPPPKSLLLQGFLIQVSNPKALLFMSAFLPQFIHPEKPLGSQLLPLLAVTIAVDVLVLSGYAYFAQRGARTLRSSPITAWLERILGAGLIFFGIRLLNASRK